MRRRGKLLRWVLLGLAGLLLVVQLVPTDRSTPPVVSEVSAPGEVMTILRRACYDCHSNETRWPWYARIAPLSWWMAAHVRDGRGDLNFSDWPTFDFELQELAFRDIEEQISKGEMPLRNYTILHRAARLSEADRELILGWARSNY